VRKGFDHGCHRMRTLRHSPCHGRGYCGQNRARPAQERSTGDRKGQNDCDLPAVRLRLAHPSTRRGLPVSQRIGCVPLQICTGTLYTAESQAIHTRETGQVIGR
jgi:hypothetical protein